MIAGQMMSHRETAGMYCATLVVAVVFLLLGTTGGLAAAAADGASQAIRLQSIGVAPIRANTNLLPNFSFEEVRSNGVPAGWHWDRRNTDASCTVDTNGAHGGQRCLRLTNGTTFGAHVYGMLWRTSPVRLQPGRPYTLSAWAKSVRPGHASLIAGRDWMIRASVPATDGQWRRIARTFTPDEKDRDFVLRINTESPTPGVWFDDLKLEEGSEATPVEPVGSTVMQLEAEKTLVEIEGEGPFSLPFQVWSPRAWSGSASVTLGSGESLRLPLTLGAGASRLIVKGEAAAAPDALRTVTCALEENGRPAVRAQTSVRFYSASNALQRLTELTKELPRLREQLDAVKAGGQDISYPLVAFTVLENFVGYAAEDARRKEVKRALAQVSELEEMAGRLKKTLAEAQAGTRHFAPVPRWIGSQRPVVRSSSFLAPVRWPGGETAERPVFFTGYGHFGQVVSDMEKWPAYGANIIQIEVGPSRIFPTESRTNDTPIHALRQTLDRAQKSGVAVCLLISPHYMPDWALKKWPHLRKHREGFLQYCLHAPEGRELLRHFVAIALAPLKDHPALHSICLANEPVNEEEPCAYAEQDWRVWLEKRHRSIGELNSLSGSNFTSFANVPLPNPFGARPAPALWMNYIRFNQEFFAGWHKMLADAVHAVAPGLPVHTKAMMWTMLNDTDVKYGVDATLFGRFSDINGNDAANMFNFEDGDFAQSWQQNSMGHDLQRSVLDAPVFNTENHVITDRDTRLVPAAHVRAALWQAALHGQSATTIWVWERTFDAKSDFAGSIMHRPACAEAVGVVNHDLNRAALEMTALQQSPPQILLLQSVTASVRDFGRYSDCLGKLYTALSFTGLKLGFVTERQLENGIVPDTTVIMIPYITHLSDAAFAGLQKFRGRIVFVGDDASLTRNEYDQARTTKLPAELVNFRSGSTSWRNLWTDLLGKLPTWNLTPAIELRAPDGQPVWGVEWRSVSTPRGLVVNLCNYRQQTVTFSLQRGGQPLAAADLLDESSVSGAVTSKPLEVRLLRENKTSTSR